MKRLICVTLMSMILLPLLPNFIFTSEAHVSSVRTVWENAWTLTTFHEDGKVNSTFFTVPKVIWNGSQWVDYVFNSSDISGGIGSVYVKFRPTYATIYDPNRTEVRIQDERWVVEWYDESTNGWRSDESYYDEISYTANSSGICFIRKSRLYSGSILKVSYVLEKGARLKYFIELTSAAARTYRIVWKLEGINGNRARLATGVIDATSNKTICNTAAERTTTSCIQFIDDFNNTKVSLNWIDTFWFNKTTGKYDTCFQGLEFSSASFPSHVQAKVLFGNFTLTKGETAYLDPTITTFGSEPPLDGYIYKYAAGEYPPSQETHVVTGNQYITVGQIGIPDRPPCPYYKYRGYVSFDTVSIPSLAYNISATLKLKTFSRPDTDFTLKIIGGQQPIYDNSLDVDDWDAGNLPITTWNTANYSGDHIYVNLPISSDQINKVGKTQFRLVSNRDEENIEPDDREYIMFYSGNSTGNEPKLEVTYYVDTITLNGVTWFYRNVGSNKIAIVLFGALVGGGWSSLYIRSIECSDQYGVEKTVDKILFLDGLIQNGFSILTAKNDQSNPPYYTYYDENSMWMQDAVLWLKNQGYGHVFLFGHSGGGMVVAHEIQKDYATLFSAATIAAAPVNLDNYTYPGGYTVNITNAIFQSAHTAAKAKVCASFLAPVSDWWNTSEQMSLYYNNMLVQKDWHNWCGGHGIFPDTCQDHPGETVSTAVLNWYNAPHPPSTPFMPSGPTSGYRNVWYTYSTSTIDPNGDNIRYEFSWGDGTSNTVTGWYVSGATASASHYWSTSETYYVKVRAQDVYGPWSGWSPSLTVNIVDLEAICALKTRTDGCFYVPNVVANLLKVEMLFNNSHMEGDQTGATSPYLTIQEYPDGKVDLTDVLFIANCYGRTEGMANWNYMSDIVPNRKCDLSDYLTVASNFGATGTYITDLTGVTVTFNTGQTISPDSNGFVEIPQGATSFTVKRNGIAIGAMIIFW